MTIATLVSVTFMVVLQLTTASFSFALDEDNDGYDSLVDDCDDQNAFRNPGAIEIPGDGIDQDCDAQEHCFSDADHDGFGAPPLLSSFNLDCSDPGSAPGTANDCDDGDAARNPGEVESTDNGIDENCDGMESCYLDSDNDGTRSSTKISTPNLFCDGSMEGRTSDPLDCNDNDPGVFPGGIEVCDGADVDEDCDGGADDDDLQGADGATFGFTDADGDGFGAGLALVSCDVVGIVGDCDDSDEAVSPGVPEICDSAGVDDDCDGDVDCEDSSCSSGPFCVALVEIFDHLECFRIKSDDKLKAYMDIDPGTNAPFELAQGCTIGRAAKYCVPVMKKVAVIDASSTTTPDPGFEGQELTDDRICYKVKCPETAVSETAVTAMDRFGSQTFTRYKSSEICTPAVKVP